MNKIPVSVGVRMPAEFDHYVHEEDVVGGAPWTIDLGSSNVAFFTQLFGFMFDKLTIVGPNDDPTQMGLDALIEPSIDAFEFSVPAQSNTKDFAVWIRYRLKIYDRNGTLKANWPLSAYGKANTSGISDDKALKYAAVLAMRDAAALIIMKIDKATGISSFGVEGAASQSANAVGNASGTADQTAPAAEVHDETTATPPEETSDDYNPT